MPELWGVCLASRKCLSCEVCAWHLTNAWAVRCVPGISRMPELWAVRRAWHLTSWLITCSAQCRSSLWPAHDQSESASCLVVRSGCRTLDQSESASCLAAWWWGAGAGHLINQRVLAAWWWGAGARCLGAELGGRQSEQQANRPATLLGVWCCAGQHICTDLGAVDRWEGGRVRGTSFVVPRVCRAVCAGEKGRSQDRIALLHLEFGTV